MAKREVICGVYQILNTKNGKVYIGISKDCYTRWAQHRGNLRRNKHRNIHLQSSWNKYGEESFRFNILEKCDAKTIDSDFLRNKEVKWIKRFDSFKNGYNLTSGGDGSPLVEFSKDRNRKISEKLKGRKYPGNSRGMSAVARKIVCLNSGKIYDCMMDAVEEFETTYTSLIHSCKSNIPIKNTETTFMYYDEYINLSKQDVLERIKKAIELSERKFSSMAIPIICLNTGEIFKKSKTCAKKYHCDNSYLIKCCKGLTASSGKDENGNGLAWMFLEDYLNSSEEEISRRIQKAEKTSEINKPQKVLCVTTGEVFQNVSSACKKYNLSHSSLKRHIDSDKVWGIHPVTKEYLKWETII